MLKPKVLVYDLEIVPHGPLVRECKKLGVDERHALNSMNAAVSHIAMVSYIWLGNKTVKHITLADYPNLWKKNSDNDSALLKDFMKEYNKADFTVAHYGEKFDRRFLNSRIEKARLPQLVPSKLRDTWRILRANFHLPNNRLDTALKYFGSPYQKPALDWSAWNQVSLGDERGYKKMVPRGRADSQSLEWLYRTILRRYDNQRPNFNVYNSIPVCPSCGNKNIKPDRYMNDRIVGPVKLYRCKCGVWPRILTKRGKPR